MAYTLKVSLPAVVDQSATNGILIAFKDFLSSNGWVIDFAETYLTTFYRVHVHKGTAHFDFWTSTTVAFNGVGCTGYTPGNTPITQPGVSNTKTYTWVVNGQYMFVSFPHGVLLISIAILGNYGYGVIIHSVADKIGAWSEGIIISAMNASTGISGSSCFAAHQNSQIYYNGGWSGNTALLKGMWGTDITSDLPSMPPAQYNSGMMLWPMIFGTMNAIDTTKHTPMGYYPDLFRSNSGDLYLAEETITIGADTYLILPNSGSILVGVNNNADYLIRLGS